MLQQPRQQFGFRPCLAMFCFYRQLAMLTSLHMHRLRGRADRASADVHCSGHSPPQCGWLVGCCMRLSWRPSPPHVCLAWPVMELYWYDVNVGLRLAVAGHPADRALQVGRHEQITGDRIVRWARTQLYLGVHAPVIVRSQDLAGSRV